MIFISERIINIAELEKIINCAKFNFEVMCEELKKDAPSDEILNSASYQVMLMLSKASEFDFCLEKRKGIISVSS